MSPHPLAVLRGPLTAAYLAGEWDRDGLVEGIAGEVLAAYHHPPSDRRRELARSIGQILARVAPRAGRSSDGDSP